MVAVEKPDVKLCCVEVEYTSWFAVVVKSVIGEVVVENADAMLILNVMPSVDVSVEVDMITATLSIVTDGAPGSRQLPSLLVSSVVVGALIFMPSFQRA